MLKNSTVHASIDTTCRARLLHRLAVSWQLAKPHYRSELVSKVGDLFDRFMDERLADPTFTTQITNGTDYVHEQRIAELLLAGYLWSDGFDLTSKREGPDFLATKDGQSVWIELITPEPSGINPAWLTPARQGVWTYPHAEIALRYTAAIKEKHAKLVGSSAPKGKPGYLANGVVGPSDPYVIAVNQHLLQRSFRTLSGISQLPTACEVLFAVGPHQLHLDRATGAVVEQSHAHRPVILKNAAVPVAADCFLDPSYAPVSAVLAVDLVLEAFVTPDNDHLLKREHLSAMVHNPLTANRIMPRWIPAQTHWGARLVPGAIHIKSL